jgi:hypothetical protein
MLIGGSQVDENPELNDRKHSPNVNCFQFLFKCNSDLLLPFSNKATSTENNAMKAYWWSGGRAPRLLDLSTRWI